jgi:methylenetetrahydrofolate--tRNA-(uracil-5-)-methyltransferase
MSDQNPTAVHVVGGGLAGCEAALQLARFGLQVTLHEMRPVTTTEAHRSEHLAEIVCSNSLKSTALSTASGVFKQELELLGCELLRLAAQTSLPAGSALAVDRSLFSAAVEQRLSDNPLIEVAREPVDKLPRDPSVPWIVATGPLTSSPLRDDLVSLTENDGLYFYDAIAPTVTLESLDLDQLFRAARYDRGDADYLNAAFDKDGYLAFVEALTTAERADVQQFDAAELFDGCLPVEEIASRGVDTLAFGPLRPVGLRHPKTGMRPHAVVQLRQENAEGTLFGLVGFQTRLRQGEQRRVLRMIPGLAKAEFVRYGQLHRNFFLDSPRILDTRFALGSQPNLHFAGQITGVEGYVESIASGLWTAWLVASEILAMPLPNLPQTSLIGSLLQGYLQDTTAKRLTPMNVNFGLLPPLEDAPRGRRGKHDRKIALGERAQLDLKTWLDDKSVRPLLEHTAPGC